MLFLKRKIRWWVRCGMASINKVLYPIVGAKKLKTWIAKYYLKRKIDLDYPKKLSEKILCLAYDSDTSLWSKLADKCEVRKYVKEKGLGNILIPQYGVYGSYEEMNFDVLPDKFVLKATHGCDMGFVCQDKSKIDTNKLKKEVNFWLKHNLSYISLELHYADIKPRIICEYYLECDGEMIDYKFFCINGSVLFVEVCSERSKGPYLDVFMRDWSPRPEVIVGAKNNPKGIKKPKLFEMMIQVAECLSEGLPFVRVDLYEVNDRIYFGEMTFTPASGVLFHFSDEFLLEQGKYLNID